MKSYTDLEQSKKLAEILPIESADMAWCNNSIKGINYTDKYSANLYTVKEMKDAFDKALVGWDKYWELIPCWSIAALLEILPPGKILLHDKGGLGYKCIYKDIDTDFYENPVDALYEMVVKLNELNYDEAIEIAKDYYNKGKVVEFANYVASNIFPEIKQSEGERIRKELIQFIKNWKAPNNIGRPHDFPTLTRNVEQCDRYIAWLENQDEQISANSCKTCKDEQKPIERKGFTTIPFGAIDSELIEETITIPNGCYATIEDNKIHIKRKGKSALEAIKEEKVDNSNKIERPKFEVGDWIVHHGTENIYQVVAVIDNQYQLKYGDNYTVQKCADVDRCVRLWDITKDAKDGDVLCYKDEISLYKHDIKNCTKEETTFGGFVYHCCYDGKRFIMDSLYSLTEQDKMDIHPATLAERDLLFQKMKESGYTWDSKKKELEPLYKCEVVPHSKKGLEMTM